MLWIWFAQLNGLPGLAACDVVSILTTAWGTWRWLGVERRSGADRRAARSAEVAAARHQPAEQFAVVHKSLGDQMHDLALAAQHAKHP